ncbi:hypothetical protein SELMODRAFT_410873 [Selaginella moellendorffii]|uniref:Uncharacterized protein n=1 Tax=Selaginella moellendorffii TaxID=88036 RepID=D8RG51_SELML|nr:hypothetical protein SELMODRAFT_410873 [Selaginella moellendorffii]
MPLPETGSKRRRMKLGAASRDSTASSSRSISSSEVVYGSPVMGLAVGRFRDRRKTRPTAILTTIDGNDCLTLRPAMASVRWLSSSTLDRSSSRDGSGDKENETSFEFPLAGGTLEENLSRNSLTKSWKKPLLTSPEENL